jgi:hypothetical protein
MRKRTNFLPTLLLTLLFFLILVYICFFIPPISTPVIIIFYLALFLFSFFLCSLLLLNSRRGFIISFGLIGLAVLQQFKLANPLNIFIVIALIIAAEIFFDKHK